MGLSLKSIPIENLIPNQEQPRKEFEDNNLKLEDLALSIVEHGLLQPIIVKELSDDSYLIIDGERRYRACIFNNAQKVACIITDSDKSDMIALIGNMTRKDLTETEKAEALYKIRTQYELSNVALARELGISEGYVRKLLKVYDLPAEVKQDIADGKTTAHEAVNQQQKASTKPSKEKLQEVAKENEEFIAQNTVEMTEEGLDVQIMLEELSAHIARSISKIETKICSMDSAAEIQGQVTVFANALYKYADDTAGLIRSKLKMERENN